MARTSFWPAVGGFLVIPAVAAVAALPFQKLATTGSAADALAENAKKGAIAAGAATVASLFLAKKFPRHRSLFTGGAWGAGLATLGDIAISYESAALAPLLTGQPAAGTTTTAMAAPKPANMLQQGLASLAKLQKL